MLCLYCLMSIDECDCELTYTAIFGEEGESYVDEKAEEGGEESIQSGGLV